MLETHLCQCQDGGIGSWQKLRLLLVVWQQMIRCSFCLVFLCLK